MPSLRSSRVALPDEIRPATITHDRGVIVDIGDGPAEEDYGDLVILPGLVDSHVHVNEPGRTEWEGFRTATAAAAAGGTTTIVDMPLNSIPPTVDPESLRSKRRAAESGISVDVAFWGGVIPGSLASVPALVDEGVCGFKVFLVDSGVPEFPPVGIQGMGEVLDATGPLSVPLLVHAEDPDRLLPIHGDTRVYDSYLSSRPTDSETAAVRHVAQMAGARRSRAHVLHVSSRDAAAIIGSGGLALSGETCPHYLIFSAEEIPNGATPFKCAPPIRGWEDREGLWESLVKGDLTMVVSDHSPAPADVKSLETGDFATAWGGISSLELRLPLMWDGAMRRGIGADRLASWLADEPAKLAGLEGTKGSLEIGKDADIAVFDPHRPWTVEGARLRQRHPICPYQGMELSGSVVGTILRGQTVFDISNGATEGQGKLVRRNDRSRI